ncbi:hypothetical protein MVES1_000353 [Malassezia vespertilionis]|uniref:Cation efflux protein transmembrane domain-containing protein n=1 Tax=Malassezia vespertilionis TaxID=2020962 RepID=A0A2N1JFZ5_9BASI|nr:uncharacterized protein MVES1_000353 [Malassezia vespertilionis]PKI85455.1 hypothetical protein MVES_000333 [Malassezia vespertilionis]WFD05028.1 hypothetical protein MVES1_000353 [Malassezia vespertilionis]
MVELKRDADMGDTSRRPSAGKSMYKQEQITTKSPKKHPKFTAKLDSAAQPMPQSTLQNLKRIASDDSMTSIRRTDSMRSLRALARLIDNRSGYYEYARKSADELAQIKNKRVREYYEKQNEVLDGWREVDEVLESQFPMEVMRRFAPPSQLNKEELHDYCTFRLRDHPSSRHTHNYDDDGYVTDEESDSIWTNLYPKHKVRRQRRLSERALSTLSEFLEVDRGAQAGATTHPGMSSDSSPERSYYFSQHMRHVCAPSTLHDLQEENNESTDGFDEAPPRATNAPRTAKRKGRNKVRHVLANNPAVAGYGTISPGMPDQPAYTQALDRTRADMVWTKADKDRDDLLQNVPTHQRKLDMDSFVRTCISVNLLINILLVAGKIVAVFSSNSVSLIASLVDSALDLLCTVVIFVTSKATAYRSWHTFYKYPVGKRRLEPLGVLIFSVLMVVSFIQVLLESINRLWAIMQGRIATGNQELPRIGIVFMLLTIVIKTVMWVWCKNSKSSSVRAIAQDSENDVAFNAVSLVFPMLDDYLGTHLLDPIGGTLLSVYIISEWIATMASTTSKLTGKVAGAPDVSRCVYMVSRFSLVQAIAGFELYHAGDTMVAEVDVVLPLSFKLKEAHDLGEIITYCFESLSGIERAYIHLDYNPAGQSGHIGQRG